MASWPHKLLLKNCLLSKSSYKLNYFLTKSSDLFNKCISRRNITTTTYDIPHRVLFFGTDDFALTYALKRSGLVAANLKT